MTASLTIATSGAMPSAATPIPNCHRRGEPAGQSSFIHWVARDQSSLHRSAELGHSGDIPGIYTTLPQKERNQIVEQLVPPSGVWFGIPEKIGDDSNTSRPSTPATRSAVQTHPSRSAFSASSRRACGKARSTGTLPSHSKRPR